VATLDLRRDGCLSIEDAKYITTLEPKIRKEYNCYIGELIKVNKLENSQLLLGVTCRNTYISLVHDRLCRLALLEFKLKKKQDLETIIIDSYTLKSPVAQILTDYSSQALIKIAGVTRRRKLHRFTTIYKNVYFCLNQWFLSKLFRKQYIPKEPIILLDTFLLKDSFNKEFDLKDRYYPGLLSHLPKTRIDTVFYLPTFFGISYSWQWIVLYSQIFKSKQKFLLKESWLTTIDYLIAIWKSLTLASNIKQIPLWRGVNVSSLIKEEIYLERGGFSITQAMLTYYAFKRFKKAGIQIEVVVDWFENQVIDRALQMGMKKYYPITTTKGYMGYIPEGYFACLTPTIYEKTGGTLPDELLVIGSAFIKNIKDACPSIDISVAPALRFQNIINYNNSKKNKKIKRDLILLAMPMDLNQAQGIIKFVLNTDLDKRYKLVIKIHPTISQKKFQQMIPESLHKKFVFTSKSLNTLFHKAKLLVTSGSSVTVEAALCGVFVGIYGNRSGPTINPLLGVVEEDYWSVLYTPEDFRKALSKDLPIIVLPTSSYLQTTSYENVAKMIGVSKNSFTE
jgi:hypothetical protein